MVQMVLCIVFFFKQKTAYEMRISDWSSECALPISRGPHRRPARGDPDRGQGPMAGLRGEARQGQRQGLGGVRLRGRGQLAGHPADCGRRRTTGASLKTPQVGATPPTALRSEEHTSELQSLMRISYAVLCLKKKIKSNTNVEFQDDNHK